MVLVEYEVLSPGLVLEDEQCQKYVRWDSRQQHRPVGLNKQAQALDPTSCQFRLTKRALVKYTPAISCQCRKYVQEVQSNQLT